MAYEFSTGDLLNVLKPHITAEDIDQIENYTDLEQRILIGAALSQLGAAITAQAKTDAMRTISGDKRPQSMGRAMVKYIAQKTQYVLDTKLLRSFYPREGHAEFYKKRHVKENVSFTIGSPRTDTRPAPQVVMPPQPHDDWHPMNDELQFQ